MKDSQFDDPMKGFRESIKMLTVGRVLDTISEERWPLAYENPVEEVIVNPDGTITIDSTTVGYAEIQRIANQIADSVFGQRVSNIERMITDIIAEIRALRNSSLERLMTRLIYPLVVMQIRS